MVELQLGIPRSTLSGWFKDVRLTNSQRVKLSHNWRKGLALARQKAVIWHNSQKALRLDLAKHEAKRSLASLDLNDSSVIELALALLYLGEGRKTQPGTSLGSSDPLILQFFIAVLRKNFRVPLEKIKCELHLRADQDPLRQRKYWSKTLKIPLQNFTGASIDKRSVGKQTYPYYQGVCVVSCGHAEIQRKLISMSRLYCKDIIKIYKGG